MLSDLQVQKVSIREQVASSLRAAIIAGEMEPGVVYSAPSLAARFGVSATPVREAMLDLTREGLVETLPNKGFRVTAMSESDLDQITQIRLLLEPPVVRDITSVIPVADFARLTDLAEAIVAAARAKDLIQYTDADRVFHLTLIDYADNPRLTETVAALRAQTRLFGLADLLDRGELVDDAREHLEIVAALRDRNPAEVERLMNLHIAKTRGRWAAADR